MNLSLTPEHASYDPKQGTVILYDENEQAREYDIPALHEAIKNLKRNRNLYTSDAEYLMELRKFEYALEILGG